MLNSKRFFKTLGVVMTSLMLVACGAATTSIAKKDLKVETKMSNTIFLEPIGPEDKTVYLQVRNTSAKPNLDLTGPLYSALINKGYEVTHKASDAHYVLQVNVLQAGELDAATRDEIVGRGFGDAIVGGLVGAGVGGLVSGHSDAVLAGALVGAALGGLANATTQDVSYSVITDIQITEKRSNGKTQVHTTRIASTANKVNLKFEQAEPELVEGLARSIAGIF
jgi:outer membrane lipoprotein SlyB